jgi:cysteine desulfurase / selenocysteine lyase
MTNAARAPLAPIADFPLLSDRKIEGRRIVYLDSAATSLKPRQVIDTVSRFYGETCANVHRGDHTLSREASALFEDARSAVARFIGATSREIIFTQNTTDALNVLADALGLEPDHNVVVALQGHHSNLLPWMSRCEVRFLPEGPDGVTDIDALSSLVDAKTRLIALGHVSNVTGAINPVVEAVTFARKHGIPVAIDGAQSVPHLPTDVVKLGCDFLAFSSHKMLGPSGVGALYIRDEVGDHLRPRKLGGGSPVRVTADGFVLKERPYSFEAGTPNIEGILGMAAAVEYLQDLGMARVAEHEAAMARFIHERFARVPQLRILGPSDPGKKIGIASLVPASGIRSAAMLGEILSDSYKIMARSGTHCAHPYFASLGIQGSLRLSTYVYNSEQDIELAASALEELLAATR